MGVTEMAAHYFKRTPTGVRQSRTAIFGPLDDNWQVPPGQQPQRLKFSLAGGKVAGCGLIPGQTYAVYTEMYAQRGATLKFEIQPTTQASPFKEVASMKVPDNYNGPSTQLGYAFSDFLYFTA